MKTPSHAINEVTRYEVDGALFEYQSHAEEYLETRVADFIREMFIGMDLPMSQAIKVTEYIIQNRQTFSRILDF